MQLFLHLWTNLEYFKLLNEWFLLSCGKSDREIADFFAKYFPWELAETLSPQYEVNFESLREMKKKFGKDVFQKIEWIYYGSDNCEYLSPYKKEIEQAVELFKEFNTKFPPHTVRTFTLVTPYLGDTMLGFLEETLQYMNDLQIKNPLEVVVNDFWVLRLLTTKYTRLKPVFGRVIHKLLKTPLIDTYGYEVHPAGEHIKNKSQVEIDMMKSEIIKWQLRFYNSAEVSLPLYQNFLNKYKVERVALDYMERRGALYDMTRFGNIGVDLYYPWALIFTGRLCDTSAVENPSRGYYAIDDICPRTCARYDVAYKVKTSGYKMTQRGNAAYRSELKLDSLSEDFVKHEKTRIIYAPFITV